LCGGPHAGRRFRAAFSGVSNPVIVADDFEVPLSYEGLARRGSALGAAGFAVYDDTVDMAQVAHEFSRFLAVESCGQCPPCKEGSIAITEQLATIRRRDERKDAALDIMNRRLLTVTDANRCYLGTEEQAVVSSLLRAFPEDFAAHLEGRAVSERAVTVPLIDDISDDGAVRYDLTHRRKRYDWSYEPT
jgi:NADH-quinone oxidoreductase subunit F